MDQEWRNGPYVISTNRDQLDFDVLHSFLTNSYWSPGIARETIARAAEHSLPFGMYRHVEGEAPLQQIGYARVVTDYVAIAYVADVFVVEQYRGQGLARWLVETILSHADLRGVRTWLLKTRDAHGLYGKLGFVQPPDLEHFMRRSGAG
jgi:GNAT superfamily N-acetyltransferase